MRFDEIAEALPGQVGSIRRALAKVGMGGKAAAAEKAMRDQAKKAYDIWMREVPRLQASGSIDMNKPEIYAQYFGKWMSKNLKLPETDPIVQKGVEDLTNQGQKMTARSIQDLIVRMMGQRRAAAYAPKQAAPAASTATTPPIKTGTKKIASDGQTYVLVSLKDNSREWHDLQGNMAPDNIQQELGTL